MRQSIVAVVMPVLPERVSRLQALIAAIRQDAAAALPALPRLHFLSMMVFGPETGVPPGHAPESPLFVLEANVDGAIGPFWAALEAALGESLRDLLRCCAAPDANPLSLFHTVTQNFSRAPIAPLLEQFSHRPAVSHRGNRGLALDRILRHAALFQSVQAALGAGPPHESPQATHQRLREALLPRFPWLATPWEPRIPPAQYVTDLLLLALFYAVVAAAMAAPWLAAAAAVGEAASTIGALLAGAACLALGLRDIGDLLTAFGWKRRPSLWREGTAVLLALAVLRAVVRPPLWLDWPSVALSGLLASALILLAALRWQERAEAPGAEAVPDPTLLRAMRHWECGRLEQVNHMGSVTIIKPGWFRGMLIRLGLLASELTVRATSKPGYLGTIPSNRIMRSIHFAHWSLVGHGGRLMFLSNFDGSWDSYLDDFIADVSIGLSLVWGHCLGFPPSRYTVLDGAARGRAFKAWARLSMMPAGLFYAAYPNLTVDQIARQAAVARGLSSPELDAAAARRWIEEL